MRRVFLVYSLQFRVYSLEFTVYGLQFTDDMKAMTKQQLADAAGVTTKTLMSWCEPYMDELKVLGMQPNMKVLPPHIVMFIAEKFCIDIAYGS